MKLSAAAKTEPETKTTVRAKGRRRGRGQGHGDVVRGGRGHSRNINQYATPDPLDYFFGKHRRGARTRLDMYGKLIEKWTGTRRASKWR